MPLYEYRCSRCGARFEKIQKFSDPPELDCPQCGGPAHRQLSAPAIQFKGSGWYLTDYARKGGETKSGDTPAGTDSPAKETKTETKKPKAPAEGGSSKPTD